MSYLHRVFSFAFLFGSSLSVGCATEPDGAVTSGDEQDLTSCAAGQRHGYDCSQHGQECTKRCYTEDARGAAYVKFDINGKTVDSRAVPYKRVVDVSNTIWYGCELLDFTERPYQGLDIRYTKHLEHTFVRGHLQGSFEDNVSVFIPRMTGPGTYRADLIHVESDEAAKREELHFKEAACEVVVTSENGGVKGTLRCDPVSSAAGTSVTVNGEFSCGGSALDLIMSRLPD